MTQKLKTKRTQITIKENLVSSLIEKSKENKMSLNNYINFLLNSFISKEEVSFSEVLIKPEKKEIASRSYFTQSEMKLLKKYAQANEWSVSREVRYRTIATLAKKPKLNQEELKTIYSTRSAINILGANLNRLIRNEQVISDHNINVCKELAKLIEELRKTINYLTKCGSTHFKLISPSTVC